MLQLLQRDQEKPTPQGTPAAALLGRAAGALALDDEERMPIRKQERMPIRRELPAAALLDGAAGRSRSRR